MFGKKKTKKVLVGDFELIAGKKHPIEEYLQKHEYYSRNLPRIAKYIEDKYTEYSIIDIGANIGDTIALLRSEKVNQQIYCIEGDSEYYELLTQNAGLFSQVELYKYFLGEETTKASFEIDKSEGTAKLNTISSNSIELKKLDDIVQKHQLKNVKLLKIDTDGFDLKILRGGMNLIIEQKPILFFEFDAVFLKEQDDFGPTIFKRLGEIGYSDALFYDNYGRLVLPVKVEDNDTIEHLYRYSSNRKGAFEYYDVCVFHRDDESLFKAVLNKEIAFFS